MNYRYDNGKWRIESALNHSGSKALLESETAGNFQNVTAVMRNPVRVTFRGITPERPATIQVFDNQNREVDMYDLANYRVSTANVAPRAHINSSKIGKLDVRRRLEVFPFPASIQIGGQRRIQTADAHRQVDTWNFSGTNPDPAPFQNRVYVNQPIHLGFKNLPGLNPETATKAYQVDRTLFTQTPAQLVAAESGRLDASEYVEETVSATYLQAETRLLNNRLTILTGVRFERTEVAGQGLRNDPNAVFLRNPDGTFARSAQGIRIRRPEAGTAGSLEELRLIRTERGYSAQRSYDGYYPSLHLTYTFKENLLVRLAYAKTYGRPDFSEIIPNAVIQEADLSLGEINNPDPSIVRGNITVRNTGLRPWSADNFDLSVEYYTPQGGLFSAGIFLKEINDFFGSAVKLATAADLQELGLDSRYLGWNVTSQFNSGDARVSGFEFNVRHSLRALGAWGRHFTVFANATQLYLRGDPYASFQNFFPRTANAGFAFNWRRLTVMPRWNYRGLNKLIAQPAFGPDGFQYIKERHIVDLSISYQLTKRLSLTGAVNNMFNNHLTQMHYGSLTPAYARKSLNGEYGAAISIGIRGVY
ncbi:MAG: TonB-dependent receptor [Opitutus sp.]|nr:TonB-dependent receptor [Opitutus sp.]